MNQNEMSGKWKELKGKVQKRWGKLTDDDLDVINGRREELVGKLQQAYGQTRKEVDTDVNNFFGTL